MKRIMIIGCCGSGKTTLARKMAEKLRLPLVHLDRLYWRDGWTNVSREEFDRLLAEELAKPCWIMDGNFGRTIPARLEKCDTVIYLDYARRVCLMGVISRVIRSYGRSRPDMGGNCPERFNWEFLKFVWNFNRTHREKFQTMLSQANGVSVIVLKSRKEADAFLAGLGNA